MTKQLTKYCESLQKLRVRLGSCKTSLSPPVDRSKDTFLVLCLGFEFLCFRHLTYGFIFLIKNLSVLT